MEGLWVLGTLKPSLLLPNQVNLSAMDDGPPTNTPTFGAATDWGQVDRRDLLSIASNPSAAGMSLEMI
jgi:hypothetical protein